MRTLEQRLESLELQVRRARWGNRVLAFALATVVCAAGAQLSSPQNAKTTPPADTLPEDTLPLKEREQTLEKVRLVDRLGRTRLELVVTDDGPALHMLDENGRARLELKQTTKASGVYLFGADGSPVASLQLQHKGDRTELDVRGSHGKAIVNASGLTVHDKADHVRGHLGLINGNYPVIGISQSEQLGPSSVEITAGDDGGGAFKIHDQAGHPLFSIAAPSNGTTYLDLRHPQHQRSLQISAGAPDQDGPQMALFSSAKQDGTGGLLPRLQLGLDMSGQPYIRIADSEGKSLFTAPGK